MSNYGDFFLGKIYDPSSDQTLEDQLLYDPNDLTTHAVVVGMTGSGKTGLCIDLLEEAALNGIPAILIDPKGDITNELLHFPELRPSDFKPWVNPDQARKDGKTIEQTAEDTASLWKNGLAKWGIGSERIQALKDSVDFSIFTPGSDAGIPVSILASLEAPSIEWEANKELLREKISSTVTALLGLVGFEDIDPVRSREHILLANIFEQAWSEGKDLNLNELILQAQSPPFEKLGVFDVNTFFPEKDRFELAMQLNNILASPAFQTWIEGEPLNIQNILYTPEGKPRHTIFYIAHLEDAERMFFVALLYSAVESWMRAQPGTTSLRAIVYFDEIFGYLPPVSNPPSKQVMLRMLKQARAFGVAQVLTTQNPVDVDYKALSNAGTWFIGKLQTDQDKQRLLDGLSSAMEGGLDRGEYDNLISSLGKRVFLLHNVHEKKPQTFRTRWAMNYLAGPLMRTQIPALNDLAGASIPTTPSTLTAPGRIYQKDRAPQAPISKEAALEDKLAQLGSQTSPAVASGIAEYFLPTNLSVMQAISNSDMAVADEALSRGLIYRPFLIAQASVRFLNRKYNLDIDESTTVLVDDIGQRGIVRWENFITEKINSRELPTRHDPGARFGELESGLSDSRLIKSLKIDFMDWVYRNSSVKIRANEALNVYAGPEIPQQKFEEMCKETAEEKIDFEIEKASKAMQVKLKSLETKLAREERELEEDREELSQRKMEEYGTHAETVLGMFLKGRKRRSISSSLSKRRMTAQAKADVEESLDAIEDFEEQIEELKQEAEGTIEEIENRWYEIANKVTEIPVSPYKKDVMVDLFGVAWLPYYIVDSHGELQEIPGYKPG